MKKPTVKHLGGVRKLEDLRNRCAIDDETGCWHWRLAVATSRGGMVPMVHLAAGVLPGVDRPATAPAARAAWLLSGRRLAPGHVVYRHLCEAKRCINPEHCAAGTRPQALAAVAATGRNRGKPERAVITAKARRSLVKPAEVVRQAEQMFAAGEMQKVVRAQLGLSQKTAAAIRQGRHVHSAARQGLLRGASVFTLGVPAT